MIDNIETDPRVAGQVTRYHTWPRTRDQSVGEHSWQVMRILLTVWPTVPRKLLVHAVLHDVGEMAGDIPYPGKRNDPLLKDRMDLAEQKIHAGMMDAWRLPGITTLTEYEHRVFKVCENLEMWEWGLHEQNLGNRYGSVVTMRMMVAALGALEQLVPPSADYPDLRPALRRYIEKRREHENGGREKLKVVHIHGREEEKKDA